MSSLALYIGDTKMPSGYGAPPPGYTVVYRNPNTIEPYGQPTASNLLPPNGNVSPTPEVNVTTPPPTTPVTPTTTPSTTPTTPSAKSSTAYSSQIKGINETRNTCIRKCQSDAQKARLLIRPTGMD